MLNNNLHPVRPMCGRHLGSTCPLLEGCQHEASQTQQPSPFCQRAEEPIEAAFPSGRKAQQQTLGC